MSKKIVSIAKKSCAACGACVKPCPKDALSIHKGLYAVVNIDKCVGCGKCAKICSAGIITLVERGAKNEI